MKTNIYFLFTLIIVMVSADKIYGQPRYTDVTNVIDDKLVAAIASSNYDPNINLRGLLADSITQRKQVVQSLIRVFNDPKSRAETQKCNAAYYLGAIRASEAADSLAAQITVAPGVAGSEPFTGWEPVTTALVAIGTPSIPSVIRNLAESDDTKVRELSLQVLTRIDSDKDISQLRLQRALKAEKDSQKQVRLQAALKSLANVQ
jgi:hypothetical protein